MTNECIDWQVGSSCMKSLRRSGCLLWLKFGMFASEAGFTQAEPEVSRHKMKLELSIKHRLREENQESKFHYSYLAIRVSVTVSFIVVECLVNISEVGDHF